MTWKPIASAPTDGKPVLLWLKTAINREYVTEDRCPYLTIGFNDGNPPHIKWVSIETEDCGSMGGEYTGWMEDWECKDVDPSHWMPLPEPPEGNGP